MIIRYYSSQKNGYPAKIEQLLVRHFADQVVEIHRDPKRLTRSFKVPRGEIGVVLLVITTPKELQFFARYGDLLANGADRVIVVLADPTKQKMKTVHQLRPSFVAGVGEDLDALAAVLEKVVYEEKKPVWKETAKKRA